MRFWSRRSALPLIGVLVAAACVATDLRVSATPQEVAAATLGSASPSAQSSSVGFQTSGTAQVCTPGTGGSFEQTTTETPTGGEAPIPPEAFNNWESGSITAAGGINESSKARIRLPGSVTLEESWKKLGFAQEPGEKNIEIIVYTYDAEGHFISDNGAWHNLAGPYELTVPTGAASIRVVIAYAGNASQLPIEPSERSEWLVVTANPQSEPLPPPAPATTDSQFCTMQQGDIKLADGSYGSATDRKEIRLTQPATINSAWTRLRFTGPSSTSVAIFAYRESGAFLAGSDWQSLRQPYTFTLPQGTQEISYAARSGNGVISPSSRSALVTIQDAPLTTDPAFADLQSGGLSGSGRPAVNAHDIRSTELVYVDPSWRALQFSAAVETTDATFGRTLILQVFPYDSTGNYLGHTSGWHIIDATPFVYNLPAGTTSLRYELMYLSETAISPTDQSSWVTITPTSPAPSSDYAKIREQTIEPEFTISGLTSGSQKEAWVHGDLWYSSESPENPIEGPEAAPTGTMSIYSINWRTHRASLIHQFQDNFGHQNDWDYSPINNDLVIGNGGSEFLLPPQFYVVPVKNLDLDGTNTLASTDAIKYTVPAAWGDRPGTVWTEQPNVIVMITDGGSTFRKLRLDTGTEKGRYGTLQSANDGEYNGTYELLGTWHLDGLIGGSPYAIKGNYADQGAAWIAGRLAFAVGDGQPTGFAVVTLGPNGQINEQITQDLSNQAAFNGVFYDPEDHLMGGTAGESVYFWPAGDFSWTPNRDR